MALATRCPNCHALFRVVADQLKLRGGLVRCGACHYAFDAIGTLSYIDDASLHISSAPSAAQKAATADERTAVPVTLRIAPVAAPVAPPSAEVEKPQAPPHAVAPAAEAAEAADERTEERTDFGPDPHLDSEPPSIAVESVAGGSAEHELAVESAGEVSAAAEQTIPEDTLAGYVIVDQSSADSAHEDVAANTPVAAVADRHIERHDANAATVDAEAHAAPAQPWSAPVDANAAEPVESERTDAESDSVLPGADSAADAIRAPREDFGSEATAASSRTSVAETLPPEDDADAPAFLQRNETPQRPGLALAYGLAAGLLGIALAVQFTFLFRTDLITQWPALRPALANACRALGCTLEWPKRGDLLAVVGTELQSLPGTNILELTAVVRNRAGFTLALPALEVTLTDTQNRAVVRKVFGPADYLASMSQTSARLADGLEAGADLTVRLVFEARGINAAGFVVYPFYL